MQKLLLKEFFFLILFGKTVHEKKRCMSYTFINMVYENSLKYEIKLIETSSICFFKFFNSIDQYMY